MFLEEKQKTFAATKPRPNWQLAPVSIIMHSTWNK